jgi:hypothetical protein
MHVPEQLFSLPLLKDVKTQPLEIVFRSVTVDTIAFAIAEADVFIVPNDRVFCLSAWGVKVTVDPLGGTLIGVTPVITFGNIQYWIGGMGGTLGVTQAAGGPPQTGGGAGSIWCPPGSTVQMRGNMNVAANHRFEMSIAGLTFPRGSVSTG